MKAYSARGVTFEILLIKFTLEERRCVDAKKFLLEALDQATDVIDTVSPDDFHRPTPAVEWSVLRLCGHMLYQLCWVGDVLAGKLASEMGTAYDGDLIGRHGLEANWHSAAQRAKEVLPFAKLDAVVHPKTGDVLVDEYLRQVAADLLVHSWDLGEALGVPVQFGADVADTLYHFIVQQAPAMRAAGLYAAPIEVPEDTSIQIQLLALSGRSPHWRQ